jgi:hypothetical protein
MVTIDIFHRYFVQMVKIQLPTNTYDKAKQENQTRFLFESYLASNGQMIAGALIKKDRNVAII